MLKIIDNKRIELTDQEFQYYQELCESYNRDNFQGKDLFSGLFETDEDGIIIFLKTPKNQFSMEIIIFLQNIMIHQNLRKMYSEHNQAMSEMKKIFEDTKNILSEIKKLSSDSK